MATPPPPPSSRPVGRLTADVEAESSECYGEYEEGGYEGEGEYYEGEGEYYEGEGEYYEEGEYNEGGDEAGGYEKEEKASEVLESKPAKKKDLGEKVQAPKKKKKEAVEDPALWTGWWQGNWNGQWWEGNGWQKKKPEKSEEEEEEEEEPESPKQKCYDAPADTWVTGADLTKAKKQFLEFEEEEEEDVILEEDVSLEGTEVVKEYEVRGTVAKIGPSIIKQGIEKGSKREVYFKVSSADFSDMYDVELQRKEDDFLQSPKLKHPVVISFLKAFDFGSMHVTVLESVGGKDLLPWLLDVNSSGKFSEKVARSFLVDILNATAFFHENGILHRGLVPASFFVSSQRTVRLIDAKFCLEVANDQVTTAEPWPINPFFQPPEVAHRKPYTMKADIWTVGVLACVLLCGRPPFVDKNMLRLGRMIREGKLEEGLAALPSDSTRDLVKQLLAPNPSDRLTATKALQHKWTTSSSDTAISLDKLAELKEFLL